MTLLEKLNKAWADYLGPVKKANDELFKRYCELYKPE